MYYIISLVSLPVLYSISTLFRQVTLADGLIVAALSFIPCVFLYVSFKYDNQPQQEQLDPELKKLLTEMDIERTKLQIEELQANAARQKMFRDMKNSQGVQEKKVVF